MALVHLILMATREAGPSLRLSGAWPGWLIALVFVGGVALVVVGYRRSLNGRRARLARFSLVGLRVATLTVILFCLARPVLTHTSTIVEQGQVFLALDLSASMNFRDGPGGLSRLEHARTFLQAHSEKLAELKRRFTVRTLRFTDEAMPGALEVNGHADGAATAVAAPLQLALRESLVKTAGVVLITDGRSNVGADPVRVAAQLGARRIPVHTLQVGQAAISPQLKELHLRAIDVPEKAYAGVPVQMKAELASVLPAARSVVLRLLIDGVEQARQERELPPGRQVTGITFDYTPKSVGTHRATIEAVPLVGEANEQNNRESAFFRVYESKFGVWILEGDVRWESKFFRRAIDRAPNLQVRSVLARRGLRPVGAPHVLPTTEEEWSGLRVLVLGDIEAARLPAGSLERTAAFVRGGGGLLIIAGPHSLGRGGYAGTPLADLLPVVVGPADPWITEPHDVRLAGGGGDHSATRLDPDTVENRRRWNRLPEIKALMGVTSVKGAAQVLLTAGPGRPLLATMRYGKGLVAVMLTDETWRWVFAEQSHEREHRRFWRQLVLWLTQSDYRESNRLIWADTDRRRYRAGDPIDLVAHVDGGDTPPEGLEQAEILARIIGPDGERPPVRLGRGSGEHRYHYRAAGAGEFQVVVQVVASGGNILGTEDNCKYQVERLELESDDPTADAELLAQIAKASGGLWLPLARGEQALDDLLANQIETRKTIETTEELGHKFRGVWLFLIVGLLTAEWVLRRFHGLV